MKRTGIVADKEEGYQKSMEAQMGTLDPRVDLIQKENEQGDGALNTDFSLWKEALQLKQILVSQRLENLKYVTGDIWNGLVEGFETAKTELNDFIEKGFPAIAQGPFVNPAVPPVKPA